MFLNYKQYYNITIADNHIYILKALKHKRRCSLSKTSHGVRKAQTMDSCNLWPMMQRRKNTTYNPHYKQRWPKRNSRKAAWNRWKFNWLWYRWWQGYAYLGLRHLPASSKMTGSNNKQLTIRTDSHQIRLQS